MLPERIFNKPAAYLTHKRRGSLSRGSGIFTSDGKELPDMPKGFDLITGGWYTG